MENQGRLCTNIDPGLLRRFKELVVHKHGLLRGPFGKEVEQAIRQRGDELEKEIQQQEG